MLHCHSMETGQGGSPNLDFVKSLKWPRRILDIRFMSGQTSMLNDDGLILNRFFLFLGANPFFHFYL